MNLMEFCTQSGVSRLAPPWFNQVQLAPKIKSIDHHQKEGLNQLVNCAASGGKSFGLWDGEGSGKTLVMLTFALMTLHWGRKNKVLILCTPSLAPQTEDVLSGTTFLGLLDYVSVTSLAGMSPAKRKKLLAGDIPAPDILIVPYQTYRAMQPVRKRGRGKSIEQQHPLTTLGYSLIIADEAKCLGNHKSTLSKTVQHAQKCGAMTVLADATPLDPSIETSIGIFLLCCDQYSGPLSFAKEHLVTKPVMGREDVVDYKNLEQLRRNFFSNARRHVIDLPIETNPEIHRMSLPEELKKAYKDLKRNRRLTLSDDTVLNATNNLRSHSIQLISNPRSYGINVDSPLLEMTDKAVLECHEKSTTYVIFCWYKDTINMLVERYADFGAAGINSDTKSIRKVIDAFSQGKLTVLVINWLSAGSGLELQAAHRCGFYEVPSTPRDFSQPIARLSRKGQMLDVTVDLPWIPNTEFSKCYDVTDRRDRSISKIMGNAPYMQRLRG